MVVLPSMHTMNWTTNNACRLSVSMIPPSPGDQLTYAILQVVSSKPHVPIFMNLAVKRRPKKRVWIMNTIIAVGM